MRAQISSQGLLLLLLCNYYYGTMTGSHHKTHTPMSGVFLGKV